jgi:hypothetical protein
MRRFVVLLLLCVTAVGVWAQGKNTLALSKSVVAIRLSNFEQQVQVFSPLTQIIDDVIQVGQTRLEGAAPKKNASDGLKSAIAFLKEIPGLKADGDLWLVVMPPPPGAKPEAPKEGEPPLPMPTNPVYLVLPLTDPAAFGKFLATPPAEGKTAPLGVVCGNTGVVAFTGGQPKFTDVAFDLSLLSKVGIVISVQPGNMKLELPEELMSPMVAQMMTPLYGLLKDQQANMQRAEVGLTMVGKDLVADGLVVPTATGVLAKTLAAPEIGKGIALEYAGYLPESLAFCSASNPMLKGAPGGAYTLTRMLFGIAGQFTMPEDGAALQSSLEKLQAAGSWGRALGVTAPVNGVGGGTLVAVYHTSGVAEAKPAVRVFVRALSKAISTVMGGMLAESLSLTVKADAETLAGQPVDVIVMAAKAPPAGDPKKGAAPAPAYKAEVRVAYVADKMMVTAGVAGKKEMEAVLVRVRDHGAGFTATPRFQAFKAALPAKARGFDVFSLQDTLSTVANLVPAGANKKDFVDFLKIFPRQQTFVSTYQEVQDGMLHTVMRMPDEHLQYVSSLVKAAIMKMPEKKADAPATPGVKEK